MTTAVSDAKGTTLPRSGYFLGVNPPRPMTSVIHGELRGITENSETSVHSWLELEEQEPHTPSSLIPSYVDQLLNFQWTSPEIPILYRAAATIIILPGWTESTDSLWKKFSRAFEPFRLAPYASIEAITEALGRGPTATPQEKHAGLSAVARLVDMLGLRRPAILRMAGVPESTFYAWQKNPGSAIRTPTVSRLLRLQAQVAILDEVFGGDGMRSWLLSADRFERLQGDDAEFAQVLTEAEATVRDTVKVTPRRRMRRADHGATSARNAEASTPEAAVWPGAAKAANQAEPSD